MNLVDNKRLFSLTPVTEQDPPNRVSKYPLQPVGDIGTLNEFITIGGNLTNDLGFKGRLMFQYNIAFDSDFYIINAASLANFSSMLLLGGCVCVKYRTGNTVFRRRLMDYRGIDSSWSGFQKYTNEVIKKNFCIEFWQDDYNFAKGITQSFMIKTSKIVIPVDTDQDNSYNDGAQTLETLAQMATNYPAPLPLNNNNQAFLDNV